MHAMYMYMYVVSLPLSLSFFGPAVMRAITERLVSVRTYYTKEREREREEASGTVEGALSFPPSLLRSFMPPDQVTHEYYVQRVFSLPPSLTSTTEAAPSPRPSPSAPSASLERGN